MNRLLSFAIASIIFSCNSPSANHQNSDSLVKNGRKISSSEWEKEWKDSATKDIVRNAFLDTSGVSGSPVRILFSKIVPSGGGSYKNISVKYQNISAKRISAIRIKWYGLNAFGEPAHLGTLSALAPGFGGGMDDDGLAPGKSKTAIWEILSQDVKKIVIAWPCEIAFEDGTRWKCGR